MYIKDTPLPGGEHQLAIYKRGWRVELENTKKINPAGVLRDNHDTTWIRGLQIMSPVCRPFLDTTRYLPTFSGYEEKLNLIIIKEGIFNCWGSFFYSHYLLFDESRIFSEEFVCVCLSWKGYLILCVSVNRILPRWILVHKTNDCNANLLYSNCQ